MLLSVQYTPTTVIHSVESWYTTRGATRDVPLGMNCTPQFHFTARDVVRIPLNMQYSASLGELLSLSC